MFSLIHDLTVIFPHRARQVSCDKWNHYLSYVCLVLKFVCWLETFKCDKDEKTKTKKENQEGDKEFPHSTVYDRGHSVFEIPNFWWCEFICKCMRVLPSFSNTNRLLLHSFMDADAILLLDAVEFINAAQTTICQDQGSCFQVPVTSILHSCYCQSFGNTFTLWSNTLVLYVKIYS